jgi:NAD(P)-dependent dehydrogenase (short-subunit alcohol dehydrogenase family)
MQKEKWTEANIPDLNGKVIIVTGGNSGLGFESVKAFAQNGAKVVLTSRTKEKGESAKNKIGKVNGEIDVMLLDLKKFVSIEQFARDFKQKYIRLDVLMNNAGIMMTPYFKTNDGLEGQIGVNHFGHFKLTGHLLDMIMNTPGSRVINVSSNAHKQGKMDFDDLQFENNNYSPLKAYGRSKLANLLFTYELQRFFETKDADSKAIAAHPGSSRTNLARYIDNKFWFKLIWPFFRLLTQNQEKGALPQIRAAVDENARGGQYYGPHRGNRGYPVVVDSSEASKNREDAKKLWEESENITGVNFG